MSLERKKTENEIEKPKEKVIKCRRKKCEVELFAPLFESIIMSC